MEKYFPKELENKNCLHSQIRCNWRKKEKNSDPNVKFYEFELQQSDIPLNYLMEFWLKFRDASSSQSVFVVLVTKSFSTLLRPQGL